MSAGWTAIEKLAALELMFVVILWGRTSEKPPILPSNQSPLGALPARFRRSRVLIVGCGDVGLRTAKALSAGPRLLALTSQPARATLLRTAGLQPLVGNLDVPASLRRLAGVAQYVVHLAPPPGTGNTDPRTRNLARALRLRSGPHSLVYASTSGVYGDCAGARVPESRPLAPRSARAQRRVDAETQVRLWGLALATRISILRVPGIYAPNREGGTPRARLQQGAPVLLAHEDVITNHIHADDLARACVLALWRARAQRAYNINDDAQLPMGDYMTAAAALYGLPAPPRLSRAEAATVMSPMQMSFLQESRRLDNGRMKKELRLRLRYPEVLAGLAAGL